MSKINLQIKTEALTGWIESYWFENHHIGLEKTLFHRVFIPLKPFDSGLDYEEQPTETKIVFDWYKLELTDPKKMDGLDLNHNVYADAEASVYLGSAHNWCDVKKLNFEHIEDDTYKITGEVVIEFENERVAENEKFEFVTTGAYTPT